MTLIGRSPFNLKSEQNRALSTPVNFVKKKQFTDPLLSDQNVRVIYICVLCKDKQ